MKLIKNIFITTVVLTVTLVTPKTHSKSIVLKSEFDSHNCSLNAPNNLDKVDSQFLKHSDDFFGNHTKLNNSKSEFFNLLENSNCAVSVGKIENRDFLEVSASEKKSIIPTNKETTPVNKKTTPVNKKTTPVNKKKNIPANREVELIAKTIWGEGRGESYQGKVAIGNVIVNRYKISKATRKSDWWGNTIEQIILHPYQFSCHNHNDPNKAKIAKLTTADYHYRESLKIARGILSGTIKDNTRGATHYFAYRVVRPRWARSMRKTRRIGNHDFYRN